MSFVHKTMGCWCVCVCVFALGKDTQIAHVIKSYQHWGCSLSSRKSFGEPKLQTRKWFGDDANLLTPLLLSVFQINWYKFPVYELNLFLYAKGILLICNKLKDLNRNFKYKECIEMEVFEKRKEGKKLK